MKIPRQPDRLGWLAGGLLTCLSLGCAPSSQPSDDLEPSLTRMEQKQDELLKAHQSLATKIGALDEKLDKLETNLGKKLEARPEAAKKPRAARPGRPDPKATYKVAVFDGDAQKGPDSAKVTIVEWSDYQ